MKQWNDQTIQWHRTLNWPGYRLTKSTPVKNTRKKWTIESRVLDFSKEKNKTKEDEKKFQFHFDINFVSFDNHTQKPTREHVNKLTKENELDYISIFNYCHWTTFDEIELKKKNTRRQSKNKKIGNWKTSKSISFYGNQLKIDFNVISIWIWEVFAFESNHHLHIWK